MQEAERFLAAQPVWTPPVDGEEEDQSLVQREGREEEASNNDAETLARKSKGLCGAAVGAP